ncbi:hypothetical protein LX32DRAFT_292034 [Colletotrichum zoysiae]|uniref:Uncharacterized protein n=1 Tax=Colletotrichum zoysiae TaxID=1216348 RepID=A0AAD9H1P7_9PEZI|nr:hypothetical protein LX32DRAFT_292034 [Colletotrichum zoysiae]
MAAIPVQAQTFDENCGWPRRLLHLPTMTSLPWTPGNRYGEGSEPRYIAISYTWGRWRLQPSELSEVKALPVRGIDWDMPRVNPEHFTVQEFEHVLKSAAKHCYEYESK